jgi:5-methylcytosine-specific restriction endonuclease McrA
MGTCVRCGKKTGWFSTVCNDCNAQWVAASTIRYHCPKCNADLVGREGSFERCNFCRTAFTVPKRNEAPLVLQRFDWQKEQEIEKQKQLEQQRQEELDRITSIFPPPKECRICGEFMWKLMSISPNEKSATYTCQHCDKSVTIKRIDARQREARDNREPIPKEVQREVWRRDGGKCVVCGSQEKLEFDHIIPVARGGANTARNIQLLCEKCNRAKSDSEPGS